MKKTTTTRKTNTTTKTRKPAAKAQRASVTRAKRQSTRSASQSGFRKLFRWTRAHTVAATLILTATILTGGFLYSQKYLAAANGGQIVGIGGHCLDNYRNQAVANNKIELYTCSTSKTVWTWTGDGTIRTLGWCLSVKGGAKTKGTLVVLNKCTSAAGQKWSLKTNGSIVDANSGLCLDDKSGVLTNGNQIWAYTCNNTPAQAWNVTKAVVPLSVPAPAAHAALDANPRHTPKPTITLDTSTAPEFGPWLNQVKTIVEQWYPVLGDYYAYPGYTPVSNFIIKVDPTYNGAAMVNGTTITLSAAYFRTHLTDVGAVIHESVHVVQSKTAGGANLPGWLVEGEADFGREQIYKDRAARTATANETYLNGYSPTANLLQYVQSKYSPTFVNDLNTSGWNGTYTDDMFKQVTGNTIGQLWTAMTSQPITSPGTLTNMTTGKCADLPNYATANQTRVQIQGCNGSQAEQWVFAGVNKSATNGTIRGVYGNKCLAVAGASKTDNAAVWYYDCTSGVDQQWTKRANGTLLNPNSGKCLQAADQKDTDGTLLEIYTCGSATAQKWQLPPQ